MQNKTDMFVSHARSQIVTSEASQSSPLCVSAMHARMSVDCINSLIQEADKTLYGIIKNMFHALTTLSTT